MATSSSPLAAAAVQQESALPGGTDSSQTSQRPANDGSRKIITFLRVQGLVDRANDNDLATTSNDLEHDVSLLGTAELVQKAFVHTSNQGRPAFCATVTIKSDKTAKQIMEHLTDWNCDNDFIGITPVFTPEGDADVEYDVSQVIVERLSLTHVEALSLSMVYKAILSRRGRTRSKSLSSGCGIGSHKLSRRRIARKFECYFVATIPRRRTIVVRSLEAWC